MNTTTETFGGISCIIGEPESPPQKIRFRVKPVTQLQSTSNALNQSQKTTRSSVANANNNNKVSLSLVNSSASNFQSTQQQSQQESLLIPNTNARTTANLNSSTPAATRQPQRRRVRRKANSPSDDQAEHLTEMSVRGLDLFRYAQVFDGIYQCTECAKENIQKTFKNKYSFQRHAFLYHEGTQRKVFPCPVCSKEFSRPDKMKNHMKTTHDCYLPKEPVYPLNYLAGSGGDTPAGGAGGASADANKNASPKKGKANSNANNTNSQSQKGESLLTRLQTSDSQIKVDNVSSQLNAQIQANAQLIKVENASD